MRAGAEPVGSPPSVAGASPTVPTPSLVPPIQRSPGAAGGGNNAAWVPFTPRGISHPCAGNREGTFPQTIGKRFHVD
jgi:hypothetical protein